jgi:hypothetical protein
MKTAITVGLAAIMVSGLENRNYKACFATNTKVSS